MFCVRTVTDSSSGMAKRLVVVSALLMSSTLAAGEIFVDFNKGNDGNPGSRELPLKSFSPAIARAQAGDTIFLLPAGHPVNTSLVIKNKHGGPGKPIIIDGMMNTFSGSRPLRAADWIETAPGSGLFSRKYKSMPTSTRFVMWFDGRMERMGRHTKWKGAALKRPEELGDFQWTIVGKDQVYLKLPAGMGVEQAGAEEPHFVSGVVMSGECSHIVVRNLAARRFWNDGYNIHNNCRDILFENIAAFNNSDDGISAHGTCRISVKNMLSLGNGTGFCHIEQAECEHENVYIADSDSRDILLENAVNTLRNVYVDGAAIGGIRFSKGRVELDDCVFLSSNPALVLEFMPACHVRARNVIYHGYKPKNLPEGVSPTPVSDPIPRAAKDLKAKLDLQSIWSTIGSRR